MGQRSVPSKGRGGSKPAIPQGLLLLGMVDEPTVTAPVVEAAVEAEAPKKGKGAAKKSVAKAPKAEKPAKEAKEPKARKKAAK